MSSEVGYIFPEDAAKQVVEVGNAIKQTDDKLLKYTEDASKLIALLKQQNISFEQLQKVQKEAADTTTKLDAIGKQLLQSETKLKEVTDKRTESIIRNRAETRNATRDIQLKIRAQQAEKGSIEQLSAVNAILEKRLKAVNLTTVEGAKKAEILRNAINRNTQKIMANSSEFSKWKINIGNYKSALEGLPGPIGNIASQATRVTSTLAKLGPLGAVIGGTIAALSAPLIAFFTKSEKGVEMLERKTAGFKAAWGVLVGEMISGGEKIADSFDKQAEQSTKWTKIMSLFGPTFTALGARMDLASTAAENYTQKIQDLEDAERSMIVPRSKANQQIKEAMLLYQDETKSMSVRINALKTAIDLENKTADAEIEHQKKVVENIKTINEEKRKAGQLRDEDDKKLQEAMAKEIDLSTESMGRQIRAAARINTAREEITRNSEAAVKAEKEATEKRAKTWADETWAKQEQKNELQKINEKYLEDFAKLIDSEIELENEKQQKIIDLTIATGEKIFNEQEKLREKEKESKIKFDEDEKQRKQQITDELINQGSQLVNTLFDLKLAGLQREFQMAEGNEKKQKEISAKMAKTERNKALFDIGISTAVGIMKAIQQTGLPAALPFVLMTTALGALQAAVVAKSVPKFATGTEFAPNEFIAGEKGRELIKTQSGDLVMANKATHFKGNRFKGATVYTNKETEQIIEQSGKGNNFIFDTREIKDGLKLVENAINRKPIAITDNSGRVIGKQSNNYRETYLNRLQNGR